MADTHTPPIIGAKSKVFMGDATASMTELELVVDIDSPVRFASNPVKYTRLNSDWEHQIPGVKTAPELTMTLHEVPGHADVIALRNAANTRARKLFRVVPPDADESYEFAAYVAYEGGKLAAGDIVTATATLQVDGGVEIKVVP